jgi:hypothetical protein
VGLDSCVYLSSRVVSSHKVTIVSTLHQFLIQWVGDDVEVVHANTSTCVPMVDSSIWTHDDVKCLLGLDLSDYDFLSVSKDGFVPVHVKPVENRLNHTCC